MVRSVTGFEPPVALSACVDMKSVRMLRWITNSGELSELRTGKRLRRLSRIIFTSSAIFKDSGFSGGTNVFLITLGSVILSITDSTGVDRSLSVIPRRSLVFFAADSKFALAK